MVTKPYRVIAQAINDNIFEISNICKTACISYHDLCPGHSVLWDQFDKALRFFSATLKINDFMVKTSLVKHEHHKDRHLM